MQQCKLRSYVGKKQLKLPLYTPWRIGERRYTTTYSKP